MPEAEYVVFANEEYLLVGSRITLASIVYPFRDGLSPETIHEEFPSLRLEQIYGALAYYLAHQNALDDHLQQKDRRFGELAKNQPHIAPELRERIRAARTPRSA